MTSIANATPALESTMKALEARIPNLHPKNRERAKGIIDNVRRYGRATDPQRREIVRLERLSKKKWRGKRPSWTTGPLPGETPNETLARRRREIADRKFVYNGHEHPEDQRRAWLHRAEQDYLRDTIGEEELKARNLAAAERRKEIEARQNERQKHSEFRRQVLGYDRKQSLPYALPAVSQPHLMARPVVIECLRRRRRHLLTDRSWTSNLCDQQLALLCVRRCMAAERLAVWRDRATVRQLQAAE